MSSSAFGSVGRDRSHRWAVLLVVPQHPFVDVASLCPMTPMRDRGGRSRLDSASYRAVASVRGRRFLMPNGTYQ